MFTGYRKQQLQNQRCILISKVDELHGQLETNNRTDSSYDSELSNILQEATGLHIWDILENS